MLGAVEFDKLFQVVWVSLVAGVGITAIYSGIIYAVARASDARRAGQRGLATALGVTAGVCFLVFLVGVGVGVSIMLDK